MVNLRKYMIGSGSVGSGQRMTARLGELHDAAGGVGAELEDMGDCDVLLW